MQFTEQSYLELAQVRARESDGKLIFERWDRHLGDFVHFETNPMLLWSNRLDVICVESNPQAEPAGPCDVDGGFYTGVK